MEECKDANFMCKYCNKKYLCGKSLGGHLKSHKIPKSLSEDKGRVMIKTDNEMEGHSGEGKSKRKLGFEDGDSESFGYGLRENPKKTRRFAGELGSIVLEKELLKCKTCGKGFQNMKALCGHMACHSKAKLNGSIQGGIELGSEKKKLVADSPSPRADKSSLGGKSKSGRRRCWNADGRPDEDSSSLSEIEKELEGLARCLIMLSRDDGKRGILRSLSDLSETKLTAKEVKPSSKSNNARAASAKVSRRGSKGVKLSEMKKFGNSEVKSAVQCSVDRKRDEHVQLLSGKVDSHDSLDDHTKIRELKEPKKKLRPKTVDKDVKVKVQKNCYKVGHKSEKENCMIGEEVSSKPANFDCQSHGHLYSNHNYLSNGSFHMDICGSAQILDSKCKCLMLDKVFYSSKTRVEHMSCQISSSSNLCSNHGIVANNHKTNCSNVPAPNSTDETFDFDSGDDETIKKFPGFHLKSVPVKKSQGHECPICLHMFHSAQALDSHKRSHFSEVSKEKNDHGLGNGVPSMLIDLNLPATVEEDSNADAGMFPW